MLLGCLILILIWGECSTDSSSVHCTLSSYPGLIRQHGSTQICVSNLSGADLSRPFTMAGSSQGQGANVPLLQAYLQLAKYFLLVEWEKHLYYHFKHSDFMVHLHHPLKIDSGS